MSIATMDGGVKTADRHFGAGVVPKPRKPKAAPVPDTCTMTLTIRGQDYRAVGLPTERAEGVTRLYRIRKVSTGVAYHVASHEDGRVTCECASFHYRHESSADGQFCKHGRALKALGLLD